MNPTKIEWTDNTWNPVTGCFGGCEYCYARRMSYRLRGRYGYPQDNPFQPTFHPDKLDEPINRKNPAKIFVVSMGDLFGDGVNPEWTQQVLGTIQSASWHTFQILTKCPQRLSKWDFPSNCWAGITIDRQFRTAGIKDLLRCNAPVKYISFEPLLERIEVDLNGIDWIIIGAQTGQRALKPKFEWVEAIINTAADNNIPVFIKDNLNYMGFRRQESPYSQL